MFPQKLWWLDSSERVKPRGNSLFFFGKKKKIAWDTSCQKLNHLRKTFFLKDLSRASLKLALAKSIYCYISTHTWINAEATGVMFSYISSVSHPSLQHSSYTLTLVANVNAGTLVTPSSCMNSSKAHLSLQYWFLLWSRKFLARLPSKRKWSGSV